MTNDELKKLLDSYFSSTDLNVSREKVRKDLTDKLHQIFSSLNYNYDTTDSSFSQLILNLFSAVIGDVVALSNFLYGESTLVTSQLYDSVYNWARMLDYEPIFSKPAKTTVQLRFPFDQAFSYTLLPFETYFVTNSGVPFTPTDKIVIQRTFDPTTNNPITIKRYYYKDTIQYEENVKFHVIVSPTGRKEIVFNTNCVNLYKKTSTVVSDNVSSYVNYEYTIELDENEYLNDIVVFVNGVKFIRGNLYVATATDRVYDIIFRSKNSFTIRFGNNVNGVGIEPGSTIDLTLYVTNGSKGNIKKFELNNTYNDSDGISVIQYSILNITDGVGGVDNLSEEEIKYNTIVDLRTRKRIVTLEDYEDFIRRYSFVDKFKILQKESDTRTNDIYLYVSLKDSTGRIIPTETIAVDYEELKFSLSNKLSQQGDIQIVSSSDYLPKFESSPNETQRVTYRVPGYLLIDLTKYTWFLIPYDKIVTDHRVYTLTNNNYLSTVDITSYLYTNQSSYVVEFVFKYSNESKQIVESLLRNTTKRLQVTTQMITRSYQHVSENYTVDSDNNNIYSVTYLIPFNELQIFRNRSDIRLEFYDSITLQATNIVAVDFTNLFYDYGPIYTVSNKLLLLDIPVVRGDYEGVQSVQQMFRTLADTFTLSTSARMLNHRTHIKFFKTFGTVKNVHHSKPDYYVIDIVQ